MNTGNSLVTFAYHLGAHCTDDYRLFRSLRKNADKLEEQGVLLVKPALARTKLMEMAAAYRGEPMPLEIQQELFDVIVEGRAVDRVIFFNDDFLCPIRKVFEYRNFYGKTRFRSVWLRYLWPENPCEFFISIRNPASFIPAAMQAARMDDYAAYVKGMDPRDMKWSTVIEMIQDNNPNTPITVWCNEDTPLVWSRVMRAVADVNISYAMRGELDIMKPIMTREGFKRMAYYLQEHPPPNQAQLQRVLMAFLDKFVIEEEMEVDINLPGWTPEFVDEVTSFYDDDVARIEQMPGVRFISS